MATVKGTTKKTATKGTTKVAAKAVSKKTIGATAIAALHKKADATAALAAVKKAFPKAKTTIGCIYWYASQEGIKLQKPAAEAA